MNEGGHIKVLNYSDRPGSSVLKPKMLQHLSLLLIPLISQEIGTLNSSYLLKRTKEKFSQLPPNQSFEYNYQNLCWYLFEKFYDCIENNILVEEQAGVRPGKTTIDQAIILLSGEIHLWIQRFSLCSFVDLRSALDSLSREILWKKLLSTNNDKQLLLLIYKHYSNTKQRG